MMGDEETLPRPATMTTQQQIALRERYRAGWHPAGILRRACDALPSSNSTCPKHPVCDRRGEGCATGGSRCHCRERRRRSGRGAHRQRGDDARAQGEAAAVEVRQASRELASHAAVR